jgi:ketosteroid isomerase-like protein
MTEIENLGDFKGLEPFFRIIEQALSGLVDGEHFFDLHADDVVVEYIHTVPGYPRKIVGRSALVELYRPYSEAMMLHRCFDLVKYYDREAGVVVLEYASEGHAVSTGAPYANRFISVITITDRKITRWRDYLDPIAVFDALGWPPRA